MRPGAMQFTVMPFGPSSRASDFAQPTTPGRIEFESARLSIGSRTVRRRDVDDPARRAALEMGEAEAGEAHDRDEQQLDGGLDLRRRRARSRPRAAARPSCSRGCRRRRTRRRPSATRRSRSSALVTSPATASAADPLGLALEELLAPREHDDVRALARERLGDAEADARGRAADDRRPAAESEIHRYFFFRTPTTSRTAAADARSIFFSSAVSRSFTISSTPAAPSLTGTPM